jgi:CDP-diacylglycerol--serine O-phosphatidyltransferase
MVMKRRQRSVRGPGRKPSGLPRGVFLLPNLLTTGGLLCGFYSIIASMRGDFVIAAVAVMAANVFDVLDGRVARVTKSTSAFGMQYDSLSDLVAFGVAPGILVYRWALEPWGTVGWLAASLYVTCGALRLARFNVQYQHAETRHFVGLPIPAAAEVIALTVLLYFHVFESMHTSFRHLVVLLMVYGLAGLMVSNVRYFSFKEIDLHRRQPFWVLIAAIVMLKILVAEPQVFLFSGIALYALSGPAQWLLGRKRRWLPAGPESDLTGAKESSSLRLS